MFPVRCGHVIDCYSLLPGIALYVMNVSLSPELQTYVLAKVKAGRYSSASEVVREALRLLQDHENARAAELAGFRSEVDRRLASLDRGEGVDGESIFAGLRRKSEKRRKTQE